MKHYTTKRREENKDLIPYSAIYSSDNKDGQLIIVEGTEKDCIAEHEHTAGMIMRHLVTWKGTWKEFRISMLPKKWQRIAVNDHFLMFC